MLKQERTFSGARTELKMTKGESPQPYVHKVFDVTISDEDFQRKGEDDYGREWEYFTPLGITKIRSVFIFSTKRKNTLSVMVVLLTPKYNKKGQLIAVTNRQKVFVNPVTKKVWRYENRTNKPVDTPFGWENRLWLDEILKAVEA